MRINKDIRFLYIAIFKGEEFILDQVNFEYIYTFDKAKINKNFEEYRVGIYRLYIDAYDLDSAYRRSVWGEVDGFGMEIGNYVDGKFSLMTDTNKEGAIEHFEAKYSIGDGWYETVWRNEEEIDSFWEIRESINGFPFNSERKVYLKKDGIWLDDRFKPS